LLFSKLLVSYWVTHSESATDDGVTMTHASILIPWLLQVNEFFLN